MRQLLLDPAVNREFKKIHKALEDKSEEAKRLLEELQGTLFQQESKQGRLLVARCRVLIVSRPVLDAHVLFHAPAFPLLNKHISPVYDTQPPAVLHHTACVLCLLLHFCTSAEWMCVSHQAPDMMPGVQLAHATCPISAGGSQFSCQQCQM